MNMQLTLAEDRREKITVVWTPHKEQKLLDDPKNMEVDSNRQKKKKRRPMKDWNERGNGKYRNG